MMPTYGSCTEYISPSGNTQIYIVRRPKAPALQKVSDRRKYLIKQKALGTAAIIVGIITCLIFPEDCGGGIFAIGLGLLRVISNR